MLVLAATTGSPVLGAAVMAMFVIATAPAFAVYGYLSQKVPMRRWLTVLLGAIVVVFGLVTVNGGLAAGGAPFAWRMPSGATSTQVASAAPVAPGTLQEIKVQAFNDHYAPGVVAAASGSPIRVTFVTQDVRSCILATTMPTLNKELILPSTGSKSLDLGVLAPGDYPIVCSMGMYSAVLHVA